MKKHIIAPVINDLFTHFDYNNYWSASAKPQAGSTIIKLCDILMKYKHFQTYYLVSATLCSYNITKETRKQITDLIIGDSIMTDSPL